MATMSNWECKISIDTTKEGCQPVGGIPTHYCQLSEAEVGSDFSGQYMPSQCTDFCYKRSEFEKTYPKECIIVETQVSTFK